MKVLFIFDRVYHYQEDFFKALEVRLGDMGHELHLATGVEKSKTGRIGLTRKIIKNQSVFKSYQLKILSYTARMQTGVLAKIKEIGPDIVVVPGHVGNVMIWWLAKRKKTYRFEVFSWQCGYEYHANRLKRAITSKFLAGFSFHLAYHGNAERYLTRHGVPKSRVGVIHNTINDKALTICAKASAKKNIESHYPALEGKVVTLYVGAVLQEKNLDVLVKAMGIIDDPRKALLIVGDGEYLETLRARYQSIPYVVFAGRVVEGVGMLFDASDIFALPGTGGLALNEAMAHSLPIVSGFADGRADDLIRTGVNGFRWGGNDPIQLAGYISSLMADESMRVEFGKRGRRLIDEKFSHELFVNRVSAYLTRAGAI